MNGIFDDKCGGRMKNKLIQFIKNNREEDGMLWRFACFITKTFCSRVSKDSRCPSSIISKSVIKSGSISNTISIGKKSVIRNCHIIVIGNNSHIKIGEKCILTCAHIIIIGDNANCYIGDKVTINANKVNMTGINVGDNTTFIIGDESLLSKGIGIYTTDFHRIYDCNEKLINKNQNVTIGGHVWIGMHTVVLKGTIIPDGCVIGAGSLVSTPIREKNSVSVGRPAKVIKKDIQWVK